MNRIFVILIVALAATTANAEGLEHCTHVSLTKGAACGNSPASVALTINADQCKQNTYAKACFEQNDGNWQCYADVLYEDEGDYTFSICAGTGNYLFDVCAKGKNGYECGYEPTGRFLSHQCESGKKINYKVDVLAKGVFKLMVLNDKPVVLNQRRRAKNGAFYLSASDVNSALCSEPLKASAAQTLIYDLTKEIREVADEKYKECIKNNSETECRTRLMGTPDKAAVIGVRG